MKRLIALLLVSGAASAGTVQTIPNNTIPGNVSGHFAEPEPITVTGTGSVVLSTSPTLVTPLLGTPTSGVLTNEVGLPLTTGITGILGAANGGTGFPTLALANIPVWSGAITSGHCVEWLNGTTVEDSGSTCGAGGGSAFSAITSSTNITAAMLVGAGASLAPTTTGTVTANLLSAGIALGTPTSGVLTNETGLPLSTGVTGTLPAANVAAVLLGSSGNGGVSGTLLTGNGGTGAGSLAGASIPVFSGTPTAGHCVEWLNGTTVEDAGAGCGGAPAFSAVSSGSNTTAAMTVNSGATFGPIGTGIVNANELNGGQIPASALLLGSNGSSQPTNVLIGGNLAVVGGILTASQSINPIASTTYAILATDGGKLITRANASSCADTLPAASTAGYTAGYSIDYQNLGSASCTITPATSTINGASLLTLAANTGCTITSDGANYQTSACTALITGGNPAFSAVTSGTNSAATMTCNTGCTITTSGSGAISGAITATTLSSAGATNINVSHNSATSINTGTTTSAITLGNPANTTNFDGPVSFAQGTTYSGASWTTNGIGLNVAAATFNDSTGTGTIPVEAAYAIGAPTFTASSAVTITYPTTLYVAAPIAGTNVTGTGPQAIYTPGNVYFGGISSFAGNVGVSGTLSAYGAIHAGSLIQSGGSGTFSVASGTGACATTSTLVGGYIAGSFVCTGTTGASTVTLTLPTASHGYVCLPGRDVTTPTTITQTGAVSTTSVTFTLAAVVSNDVIQWACPLAY